MSNETEQTETLGPRIKGKITSIHINKGYGFIEGEDKKDYFFHMSAVLRSSIAFRHLKEKNTVEFNTAPGTDPSKCMQARNLALVSAD